MMQRLVVLVVAAVILAAFVVGQVRQFWIAPLPIAEEGFLLRIEQGESLRSVTETLRGAGVLRCPRLVSLYGRWTGLDQNIKRGEYRLPPMTTVKSMLELLERGAVIQYQVTLPEGVTLGMALEILSQQEQLETVLSGPEDSRLSELVEPYVHPEGLFFPDSYHYARGDTDWSILQRAHKTMMRVLQEEWNERGLSLPYASPYEALIMASIVERETGLPAEREQISGVFVRRLQKRMRLQTDPTVIYGLGSAFDGNLRRKHLSEDSNPYNTYRHPGLPPTPIALPGRAAIRAALHPQDGEYLYFVARGDGGHVFSATLGEHNRAVRDYQLKRRKDYRSAPEK
jgi:UPF0755 protein